MNDKNANKKQIRQMCVSEYNYYYQNKLKNMIQKLVDLKKVN